jgi:uroporphyrinogen-III synthase
MRLLVTRPADQAATTAQKLEAFGHEPVVAPVLEIAATGAFAPPSAYELVLATSAQALASVETDSPLLRLPFACVGEKTAAAARSLGFSLLCVSPQAEALAERLLATRAPSFALYLAGRERKPHLEERLRAADWRIEIVETYAARPVAAWTEDVRSALGDGQIDGVLHYSPRSAALALALIGSDQARRLRHFCLSPDIASVCREWAPEENIFTASHPDELGLLTLLRAQDGLAGS